MKKIFMHYWRIISYLLVNHVFAGPNPHFFRIKRWLLRSIGFKIGENTKIVAPFYSTGEVEIGSNCWIGANFVVRGLGKVVLGNNIDVGPDTTYITGTHYIGDKKRRAGTGYNTIITIGNGCWLGAKSVFVNNITIGESCVIAASACVCKDIPNDKMVGGVPARIIKELD